MTGATQDGQLRWLLRRDAQSAVIHLMRMLDSGTPALAEGAAALIVHGEEFGAWATGKQYLRRARALSTKSKPVVKSKREAKSMTKVTARPLSWDDLGPSTVKQNLKANSWPALKAALQAHGHMCWVLADPSRTRRARFTAISAWVAAVDDAGMGDIFPADFRALLAAADRNTKLEQSR